MACKNLDYNTLSGEEFYKEIINISNPISYKEEKYNDFIDKTIKLHIKCLVCYFRQHVVDHALKGFSTVTVFYSKDKFFDVVNAGFCDFKGENSLRNFRYINLYAIGKNKYYQEYIHKLFPKPFIVTFTDEKHIEKIFLTISWKPEKISSV